MRTTSLHVSWVGLVLVPALGCSSGDLREKPDFTGSEVVYGADDRYDPFEYPDAAWAARALEFTAALIPTSQIDASNPDDIDIGDRTWQERANVCADERFAQQPALADCTGTLIDHDLVLTAGHCINNCNDSRFVFNYALTPAGTLPTITSDDVHRCVAFITYAQSQTGLDYTVVRLERPVVGREPAPVRMSASALPIGTPLVVSGFPGGLPLKIADQGSVRSNHPALQHFVSNLDTYRGNSGSGVFDANTGELAGVLVRGEVDFVADGECVRSKICAADACRGEDAIYAFHPLQDTCERTNASFCSCGDGACGPLESPSSCASDCSCGDGVCSSGESTSSCPADCRFQVLYNDHTPQPNWLTFGVQVRNTGADAIFVGRSVVRYYFTKEPAGSMTGECWGCSSAPQMTFHEVPGGGCANATHYVDVRLPDQTLPPAGTTERYRLAASASSWLAFDPANDYSYRGINWNWAPNPRITMYRLGMRVFGDEPCPGQFIPPAE